MYILERKREREMEGDGDVRMKNSLFFPAYIYITIRFHMTITSTEIST